jgi:hypothetical protein
MKNKTKSLVWVIVLGIIDLLLWIFWASYKIVCSGWNIINPLCWGIGFLTKLFLLLIAIAFGLATLIKFIQWIVSK